MVWYGKTLFNDAVPDSNLLISTGGVKTLNIIYKGKKRKKSLFGVTIPLLQCEKFVSHNRDYSRII